MGNEAPKEQDAPITQEQLEAQMKLLTERARAAGLKPLQTMAQTYAKRFMDVLEGVMGALENEDSPKKKEK